MSNQLPLNIEMGALPPNQAWTPQQLADAIAARLRITTQATLALFVAGSTAPTSDSGPWWKDNATWYRWDSGTGTYVPQLLEPSSLGYWIGDTAPDPNVYRFWIETAADLQPLGLKTYYSGAWTDVYSVDLSGYLTIAAFNAAIANYSTTAQMNTAISNAISAIPGFATYSGQAELSGGPQSIAVDSNPHKCTLNSAPINQAPGPWNTSDSSYICPADGLYAVSVVSLFTNNTGTAAGMSVKISIYVNGSDTGVQDADNTPSPNGSQWTPGLGAQLLDLNAGDFIEIWATAEDGVNSGAINLSSIDVSIWRVSA